MTIFYFVMALAWTVLLWLEASRGLLTPWFPGYICAPGFTVATGLGLRKVLQLRQARDRSGPTMALRGTDRDVHAD